MGQCSVPQIIVPIDKVEGDDILDNAMAAQTSYERICVHRGPGSKKLFTSTLLEHDQVSTLPPVQTGDYRESVEQIEIGVEGGLG